MDFRYKAKNPGDNIQTGIVKASDETAALEFLRKNNLDVFFLEQASQGKFKLNILSLFNKVSKKDLVVFSRQLAVLIESNVPIMRALRTISEQTENETLRETCRDMTSAVEEGASFSQALQKYPKLFDKFYVSVVKTGEASGDLQHSLKYLADHTEKSYELQRKVKGAMLYPIIILTAFTAIFIFLTVKVLPQLTDILKQSGVNLPWTTRIIILTSDFMSHNWGYVLAALVVLAGGFAYLLKTEIGRTKFDSLILIVPVLGKLVKYAYITRFAENLRVLLKEGVSIVKALRILAEVMDNDVYKKLLVRIMRNVEKGESMADAMMENDEAFPRMVAQMVKVGEEAGRTVQVLENIENFYRREVDNMTDNLTTIIEPILIIILGGGTGILVAAIIMPIYDMANSM